MELSARLKARIAGSGMSEHKIQALLEKFHGNEAMIWNLLNAVDETERRAKADGVAYKAAEPTAKPRLDVQAVLKKYKAKQLDDALTAAEIAIEDRYEQLLGDDDDATAQQFVADLAAWAAAWQPGQAAAATTEPPAAAAKAAPDGISDFMAHMFPGLRNGG